MSAVHPDLLIEGFAIVNLGVSMAIAWICICRGAVMDKHSTRPIFRAGYVLMFVAAIGNGASRWLFPDMPLLGGLMVACSLLVNLALSMPMWRNGVPDVGRTHPMPLYEETHP